MEITHSGAEIAYTHVGTPLGYVYHGLEMSDSSEITSATDQQLLIQFGERLRRERALRGLTTVEMAKLAGLSRTTLRAIEAGESSSTIGSYLRVMRALGSSGDIALLARDARAAHQVRDDVPAVAEAPAVAVSDAQHQLQDLQSLALHQEAVRLIKKDPELIRRAIETLNRWRNEGESRAQALWDEWSVILHKRAWRRALAHTQRSQALRQASPLATVLPEENRRRILEEVQELRRKASSTSSQKRC